MKKVLLGVLCLTGLIVLAGCSTMKSGSLENRVQTLETRVQALEGTVAPGSAQPTVTEATASSEKSNATIETMTKKDIQKALKNAGYYEGTVDGKIGSKTKTAIKEFQKANGLKSDGVAGRQTKEKLLKYLQ